MSLFRSRSALLACALILSLPAAPALGHETGDWIVRGGFHLVDPKSNNGDLVEVDDDIQFTFDVTYMLTQNWGVELLAALPFKHDISLVDGPKVASTKHLPPTLSVIYHFLPDAPWQPYLGVGLNVTIFFDESTRGDLAGVDLDLDTSVGAAAVAGVDVALGSVWFLNAAVRWLNIQTDAKLDGVKAGKVKIDPWAFGLSLGYRF
jgi:outer membrane protein